MRLGEKRALEEALRDHYRTGTVKAAAPRAVVKAVATEMARPAGPRTAAVVAEQARRVGVGTWALHGALAAVAVPSALSGLGAGTVAAALGAALALATLVGITRSRSCGMAELEAACLVNAQAAVCARALALCCADALAVVLLAVLAGQGVSPWAVFAQGCAPYLAAFGAGLLAARRAASPDATAAAVVAAAVVCAVCIVARTVCPAAFGPAAALAWWAAAVAALTFAAVEARAWFRFAASGFADPPASAAAF